MSLDDSDREERTIFVGNLSEKATHELIGELFLQAGPLERVSIPKEKDGKNKSFGFVTYKHLVAVPYALNVFSGTKLFGRELHLKNRNTTSSNRNSMSAPSTPNSLTGFATNPLLSAISDSCMIPPNTMMPAMPFEQQQIFNQQMFSQQLPLLDYAMQLYNQNNSEPAFPSTRPDQSGSQRDLVDRNRYHRDDDRNNRNKPYNRSRSPPPSHLRNRSRSPNNGNNRRRDDRDRRRDDRGYHRWNYRK